MALSYDQRKKSYDSMDDSQKQQYNDLLKSKGDDYIGNQYMKQYQQATQPQTQQPTSNEANFNNQNGTNGQNVAQNQTPTIQKTENQTYGKTEFDKNEQLDESMFKEAPGQITVKEGSAKDTGKPDYTLDSDARLNEMKGNLDQYFKDSPRMFSDRETFNRVFEYNNRESEAQRQLLDSYWKRKEDMDKASQYNSGESIANGMKNSEITTDQLNLLKEYNPDAYRQWQDLQEEEIKKRIVNDIVPPLLEEISQNMVTMMNNLGIQPQDALDIEGIYNDTMDRTGAYQTLEDVNRTVRQIEEVNNKRTAIMNRYAASTGGTVSDALAAARMQKALAPYDTQMQGLQYQYQDYANLYSQKQATATQAANVRAMQAQENQRVWQQRLTALGFAADAMSYRTPEQQAQLRLQEQQAQNEMNLLYQSKLQDLNRYNTYATAKLQNQLQNELTDLSVEDEAQLKANLNNILSDYYKNYGDIIQRSQPQAVEDIIAYAKKNGVSVAEALTQNFIKPLQNKAEYKQKVATDYGMLSKQSIATINGRSVIMTTNPNGSISYRYIDDPYDTGIASMYSVGDTNYVKLTNGETMTAEEYNKKYGNKVGTIKPYDMVDSKVFDTSPQSHSYYTLADFINDPKYQEGKKGGQCAAFVNDYLEKIGVGRYFGTEDVKTRESWCNSDTAKVGTIAVFDYDHYIDGKNYGHVGIVVDADENGFRVLDSNYDTKNPGTIQKRYVRYGSSSCKGFFDPSQPPRATSTGNGLSDVDEAKKQNYIEEAMRGRLGVNDTKAIGDLAAEQGWSSEWQEALKQGQNWEWTPTQTKGMEKADDTFYKHPVVKAFDEASTQYQQLVSALNDTSGVGDMSAIFTFMKTLDPTSVVRESEFNSAAATAGVLNPSAIWQKLEKNINGEFLTPKQREDFKKIAKEFIEIKARAYQTQYDVLSKKYEGLGVEMQRGPANVAEEILSSLGGSSTGPTNDTQKYFDGLQSTLPTNTGNVTANAMYSKVDFILNGN